MNTESAKRARAFFGNGDFLKDSASPATASTTAVILDSETPTPYRESTASRICDPERFALYKAHTTSATKDVDREYLGATSGSKPDSLALGILTMTGPYSASIVLSQPPFLTLGSSDPSGFFPASYPM